jgi:5'-nucleotidase (lipoprotein e(P4) family)
MRPIFIAMLAASLLCGCTLAPATQPPAPAAPTPVTVVVARSSAPPLELHWFRNAAERVAIDEQTFRAALAAATRLSSAEPAETWAVVLDVDETTLDNSEYQARTAITGQGFNAETWAAWVHEQSAPALPGAKQFTDAVQDQLHGKVVFVTNRNQDECADTEANLKAQNIRYDRILCAPNDAKGQPISDKNGRFQAIQEGDAKAGIPALKILVFVGDNIQDFPKLSQRTPGNLDHFGVDYFLLPNPMYGSWVKNVYR